VQFEAIFKIAVGTVISLVIASYASMSKDVTTNKVRIDGLEKSVKRTEKMVNDLHWHLLRNK
tara:strand:- start:2310 stop:2495 length:186 start_codon:yes stop_codon:yes gene_type:complete